MYKNYFLFEKQINEIKPLLLGKSIQNVFTYQKNETVIELSGPEPLFLLINISTHLPYLLLQPAYNIRQPKYQLFQEIYNQVICNIYIQPFDKNIILELENHRVEIFFYGKQPNIFILDSNKSIINSFKTGAMPDPLTITNPVDFRQPDSEMSDFTVAESIDSYLKNKFTAINHTIVNEIVFRFNSQINEDKNNKSRLRVVLNDISYEMEQTQIYLYRLHDSIKKISLFRLYHLENKEDYKYQEFDTLNNAWQRYISEKIEQAEFYKLYKSCEDAIKRKRDYLQRSLKHAEELKDLQERKVLAELKGNLLLTFKSQIKIDKNEVVLENIFSDNLEKIHIKVNPNKSISENAQIYFNKFKDLDKKHFAHSVKIKTLQSELDIISELNIKINAVKSLPDLKKISKRLIDLNILKPDASSSSIHSHIQTTFKHLILEDNWHVYIGKSGENNDELTFKFANKQDYWFHAQGVPGSHVILKSQHKEQAPPYHILEQAAGIAAANSKAKHSSTVPVIYTQVRYISRIRNAPKGTVNTRNEKTLFVEPLQI